jgi:serine protease AprX
MDASLAPPLRPAPGYRFLLALVLGLLLASLLLTPSAPPMAPRANPQLLELAAHSPSTAVDVIVQKLTRERTVEARLVDLGGTVSMDLPIVNGFLATMPAGAAPTLAQDPDVRWISLDTPLVSHSCTGGHCIDTSRIANAFVRTVGADQVWNRSQGIRGQGIGVAVLDSGINDHQDLYDDISWNNRLVARVAYNRGWNQTSFDLFGHGNHVAGIIGSNGNRSNGAYVGIAPRVNLINVKISDDLNQGTATTSSLVAGMQWIYENRSRYNIRVVNISLTDSIVESYHVSVLAAAAETLWFNGIVVVAAAGNSGDKGVGNIAAPANDPFVITVGASDDRGTASPGDDTLPSWSSYGRTYDGFAKPDLVAPGVNLITALPVLNTYLAQTYPNNIITDGIGANYFRMSGTSVAAPVVAGAVALLLQDEPHLTPDQVKYRLMATTTQVWPGNPRAGAGLLNIQRALDGTTTQSANTGVAISALNDDGSMPATWSSPNSTAKWSTAKWSTAKWSTAKWSTAKWSTIRP